jgi:hypothetical protein
MKTKFKIFLVLLVLFTACSEDFLEKKPLVQSSAESFYSNESEANAAIIGIYSILQNEGSQIGPFLIVGDDCSDNCDLGNNKSEAFPGWGALPNNC